MFLKKQPDSTYALDICKDDKKSEAKRQIFLDSAVEVLVRFTHLVTFYV